MANILVVEDDLILAQLILSALREDGHYVHQTSSSRIALDLANNIHTCVNLILTEVTTGAELAKYLLRKRSATKVVFMSASTSFIDATCNSGSDVSVLKKPFTADKLRQRVRETLAGGNRKLSQPFRRRHELFGGKPLYPVRMMTELS